MLTKSRPLMVNAGLGIFLLVTILIFSQGAFASSTIIGNVYDKQRNPLVDVDVELLDDLYRVMPGGRTRTDASGRYEFNGLGNGNYTVRVFPFRYDLEDQSLPIEINTQNFRGGQGSGYFSLDFYLQPRRGGLADAELGVVFAQEIPPDAKKLYDKSLDDLAKKRTTEGVGGLIEAVKVFPTYYNALHRLGKELYVLKKYEDAYPYFLKAVEVNPKSATSFYYLGSSLHNLGKQFDKSALSALNQAHTLAPASATVLFALGKVERSLGNFQNSEKHLLQAKKLSKTVQPEIHKELAQLYADDLKKYDEAANELELYLKASKMKDAEEKQVKKVITGLREKAKTQVSKN
jgi:tetratricopeptide (TPR) repeat protein